MRGAIGLQTGFYPEPAPSVTLPRAMDLLQLKQGVVVRGPALPEPIEVLVVSMFGDMVKIVGAGKRTGQVHQRVLPPSQIADLEAAPEKEPFDGDPARFRIGVEAARLGWPTSTIPTSRFPSLAWTRCRTSLRRSTTTS